MGRATWCVATLLFATGAFAQLVTTAQQRTAAEHFGLEIERAFNQRDEKALANLIDFHGLAMRTAQFQGMSGKAEQDYVRGIESVGVGRLVTTYFQALDDSHGTVKFMRVTNTVPARTLVRLDMGDHGFNYFEYVLATSAEGKARAVDWFQLTAGDLMSVSLGGFTQVFMNSNSGMLERLFGGATVNQATLGQLRKIGDLHRAGKYAEALALLKQLPDPVGSSRMMLAARASMAMFAKLPDEYDAALAKMAAHYSDDPSASFILIDYYFTRHDTPRVLKALTTMEQRVGVDGVTTQLRANTYFVANDFANALKYADDSIRLEPERLAGYDTRASILVRLARFQEAVDAYRGMEKTFGLKFTRNIFLEDPVYTQLVASKPFRAWLPK